MVIDGQKEEAIEEQLALEIQYLQERHADGKKMLEFMGAGCPAMGMVGTLVGLVQMFSNMESPEKIGAGMAAALVCTFYGAFLANLFFLPMAGKLGIRTKKERILREMVLEGVIGLVRGESPTNVRERMQAFVSAMHREELKPKV
jgi:chemotaxis protein MotA